MKGADYILILISQKRGDVLDNLKKKYNLEVDKINVSDLATFLTINKAKIEHATHVVIDLWGLIDTNEEITKAIDTLVNVYENARIIILADRLEGRDNSADLLNRIVKRGVFDILKTPISHENEEAFEKDFMLSFEVGKVKEEVTTTEPQIENVVVKPPIESKDIAVNLQLPKPPMEKITPNKSYREYKNYIIVSMAGTEPHVGVTHNALLVARFLGEIGFKVAYVEVGAVENKISTLNLLYPNIIKNPRKNCLQRERIDLFSGVSISEIEHHEYDVYILDIGTLTKENLSSFLYKDVHIVVSGGKSWELAKLSKAFELLNPKNAVNVFLNFALEDNKKTILEMIGERRKNAYFVDYVPNYFDTNVNMEIYKSVFEKYLLLDEMPKRNEVITRKRAFFNMGKK